MRIKSKIKLCIVTILSNKFRYICLFIFIIVLMMCFSHIGERLRKSYELNNDLYTYNGEPIDAVYTWVDGSEQKFQSSLQEYLRSINQKDAYDFSETRFDDKYELKCSLRSLEKYAPWIRHVYIVTNGQIPYWLNLDYKKVTIVTHDEIFPDKENLPTFSSPAIEANIHRIPGLSRKFIYFNDDFFLGKPIYPEDFYSPNIGYLIYLVWPLPNCAPDCPWAYVGDEQCDTSCFNRDCQFDGGDCSSETKKSIKHHIHVEDYDESEENNVKDDEFEYYESLQRKEIQENSKKVVVEQINLNSSQENFNIKMNFVSNKTNKIINKLKDKKLGSTSDLNSTTINDSSKKFNITEFVNQHNQKTILDDHLKRRKTNRALRKHKKYFKQYMNRTSSHNNAVNSSSDAISNLSLPIVSLDSYAMSLQHTNRIFNKAYEFISRRVPAHAPILIDRVIMEELQKKFEKQFRQTVRNRLRSSNDVQYQFSYYYYIISERTDRNLEEIFDQFDTDGSQTWSDREIRTILAKLNELPLTFNMVEKFDEMIINCSKNVNLQEVSTPSYERYIDSKLPTVSKELVFKCKSLVNILMEKFGSEQRYPYEILKNAHGKYVFFKMLTSNVSTVVGHLDEIRKNPRKFVCINDDRNPKHTEENDLVKAILLDFYLSLFPLPSKFELPQEYRNRFTSVYDLNDWQSYHTKIKYSILIFISILVFLTFLNLCKKKIMRKIKRYVYLYF